MSLPRAQSSADMPKASGCWTDHVGEILKLGKSGMRYRAGAEYNAASHNGLMMSSDTPSTLLGMGRQLRDSRVTFVAVQHGCS